MIKLQQTIKIFFISFYYIIKDMSITSESSNYKSTTEYSSKYRYVNLALNNISGNSIAALGNTSTQQLDFLLPSNTVYNLSKSILEYEISIPAQGANILTWTNEDTFSLANIVQLDVGSVNLVNLQFSQNFQKLNGYLNNTPHQLQYRDKTSGIYAGTQSSTVINYVPVPVGGTVSESTSLTQQLNVGAKNGAVAKYVRYDLDLFKNTYLGMDINSLFNQPTYLRFFVGMPNKMAFTSTSADADPIVYNNPTLGPAALANPLSILNIRLKLAVETNDDIINELRKKMASGTLSYSFPNVLTYRNPSAGTNASININLNSTMGSRLKDIYHMVFSSVESLNTAYDHSNVNGSKVISYNTYLNSIQIQSGGALSCLIPAGDVFGSDDYREHLRYINKGKTVMDSLATYQLHWFHNEKFYEPTALNIPSDKIDHGISLKDPIQWGFQATTANLNLLHYTFMVFIKDITVTPDTITVQ